ncbi:hypothetical protein [Lactobacillus sp. ESL0681]|uniref:hypothetical protein n=1 Tax=Lactobacillus sp. ESL0681 TaxID=2983211 RepID=UPI0023FA3A50|nr:hypothetical protein [Lactobacillus sp. ESL0681]WEV41272.1 hypothetical protein OZX59_09400 [Lactobacillus sp. ESL0681]
MRIKQNKRGIHTGIFGSISAAFGLDKQSRKDQQAKSMVDFLGYRNVFSTGEIVRANGAMARLLKVRSTDLVYLDKTTRDRYLDSFTNFNRIYTDDYKIIILSTRMDTTEQQLYWRHQRNSIRNNSADNAARLSLINENLQQVTALTRNTDYLDINFYLLIFAKDKHELELHTQSAIVADDGLLGLETLTRKQTKKVLYQMNNLNSK